jgi:Rubredoxin
MTVQRVLEYDHFFCDSCRTYVYDEETGDSSINVSALTKVDDLSESWRCPICAAGKEKLRAVTLLDEYALLPDEAERSENMNVVAQPSEQSSQIF